MGRYFGTDGVRGVANSELDALLAFKIGAAAAYALTQESAHGRKAKLLIGKDTRVSSDMLENALVAGICSVGDFGENTNKKLLVVATGGRICYTDRKREGERSYAHHQFRFAEYR